MLQAPVVAYVNQAAAHSSLTLVDVGCSRGIEPAWRQFDRRLRVLGFDPAVDEIERLRREETHAGISYTAAFAGIREDHPFARRKAGREDWGRNPWGRLSVAKWLEATRPARAGMESGDLASAGLWQEIRLAEPSRVVVIPEYLRDIGIISVDFVKIDIDGKDLEVLHSFDEAFDGLGVLGLAVEVNFFGSELETDHTFHNTDRVLKSKGFELFDLSVRRYSLAALPSRYVLDCPAASEFGRLLQGDALYLRDLGNPIHDKFATQLGVEKLLNLICLFAVFNLPDCAAEIALRFWHRLTPACDVDHILDLLARQAQAGAGTPLSYHEYVARFEARATMFFPAGQQIREAYRGLRRRVGSVLGRFGRIRV